MAKAKPYIDEDITVLEKTMSRTIKDVTTDKYTEAKRTISERTLKRNEAAVRNVLTQLGATLNSAAIPYLLVSAFSVIENLRFGRSEEFYNTVDKIRVLQRVFLKNFDWLDEIIQLAQPRYSSYLEELVKYCEFNNRPAREVVNSPQHDVAVVEAAWGSLDEYEAQELQLIETAKGHLDKLDILNKISLQFVIQTLIKSKLKKDLKEFGIADEMMDELNDKIDTLSSDIIAFGTAYLDEKAKQLEERIIIYESTKY